MPDNTFTQDLEFLNQHVETLVLSNDEGAKIVLVPQYQGRTMTSTSGSDRDLSYGYINYDAVTSEKLDPQINVYGGEDRLWISPEGGQYSVFFDPGVDMDFANWRTPASLDTESFELVSHDQSSAMFTKQTKLVNWSKFEFNLQMDRKVILLDSASAAEHLGVPIDGLNIVAHESHNTLTNIGQQAWTEETGLIGAWILCMTKSSDSATLLVPFKKGSVEQLGKIVNADYFGKLDDSRLVVDEDAGLIYFLGDGHMRSKLGVTFERASSTLGSWDQERGILSVAQFKLPEAAPNGYSNNLWEMQDEPYAGDVLNCYNDGPNDSGGQLGGFFELETISPALALAPNDSYTHIHRTVRLEGDRSALSRVAEKVFGVSLDEIESKLTS